MPRWLRTCVRFVVLASAMDGTAASAGQQQQRRLFIASIDVARDHHAWPGKRNGGTGSDNFFRGWLQRFEWRYINFPFPRVSLYVACLSPPTAFPRFPVARWYTASRGDLRTVNLSAKSCINLRGLVSVWPLLVGAPGRVVSGSATSLRSHWLLMNDVTNSTYQTRAEERRKPDTKYICLLMLLLSSAGDIEMMPRGSDSLSRKIGQRYLGEPMGVRRWSKGGIWPPWILGIFKKSIYLSLKNQWLWS